MSFESKGTLLNVMMKVAQFWLKTPCLYICSLISVLRMDLCVWIYVHGYVCVLICVHGYARVSLFLCV